MPQLKLKYHFTSNAVPEDTFYVLEFQGEEALSSLFRFEITLASTKNGIDAKSLLQEPASLNISGSKGGAPFNGVLSSFTSVQQAYGFTIYKATLVPRFWRLSITRHNQIFLQNSLQQYLATCLQDGGLEQGLDFEFRLSGKYHPRDYVCLYNESHFAFTSRWMEHYGAYYYFDQEHDGKLILTDSLQAHTPLPKAPNITYSPDTSLDAAHGDEVLPLFSMLQRPMPKQVQMRDWNYRTPDRPVEGKAQVDAKGRGAFNFYGDHFQTSSEADDLAKVRSQELLCSQRLFHGKSSIPYLCSGFTFSLNKHYRSDFNQEYLLLAVSHHGSQSEYLFDTLGKGGEDREITYGNSFTAIPASVQYRPPRVTPWPKFSGVMNAHIDAAGSGQYAEVDDQGRYKVVLPFDRSGRENGNASSWLRMAQPYGGADHGFHFPLHKGTEVLLSCVEGNPDRPLILSAAPNPDKPSQVTSANETKSVITTSGKNTIHFEDKEGEERILLHCPAKETWMRLGAPNDPPENENDNENENENENEEGEEKESGKKGAKLYTSKALTVFAGSQFKVIMGNSSATYLGLDIANYAPFSNAITVGFDIGLVMAIKQKIQPIHNKWKETEDSLREAEEKEAGIAQELVEEMTEILDEITRLEQSVTELSEQNTKLADENSDLAQDNIHLAEEHTEICELVTKLGEEKNKLAQTELQLYSEITDVQNSVTDLTQEMDEACDQITYLGASINELSQDHTSLSSDINELGASVNNIAGQLTIP